MTSRPPLPSRPAWRWLSVRDPELWLVVACSVVVVLSVLQVALFSFGRDQGIYAVVADGILNGSVPYRDLWDFKPPGIFAVYTLSHALFGKTMWAPRVVECAGLLVTAAALVFMGQRVFGSRRAGLMGAAVMALVHAQFEFWHTGQPESFGGFLTVLALVGVLVEPERLGARVGGWVLIGVLFGCAFLLKPPLGGGVLVCASYLARREMLRTGSRLRAGVPVLITGAASVAPLVLCGAWFWAKGGWPSLQWTLFEFTPGYTRIGWEGRQPLAMLYYAAHSAVFNLSSLIAAGALMTVVRAPIHSREREALLLMLGVLVMQLTGIALQGKFFPYHYGASVPLLAAIAGLGFYKLWRWLSLAGGKGRLGFVLAVAVLGAMRLPVRDLPGTFWQRSVTRTAYVLGLGSTHTREALDRRLYYVSDYNLDADRRVANALAALTPEGARVFVWGFEPVIYWLSEREPASRFIYDVPQRVSWERDRARGDLLRELGEHRPAVFVVQRGDIFAHVTGDKLDSAAAMEDFPELERVLDEEYRHIDSIEDFELYGYEPERLARLTADR